MTPVALTIAGSDPSGGAGIQADLKTFHQFGVYGEAVITLITVQNTRAVNRVEYLDPALVVEQIEAVTSDIPPACCEAGSPGNRAWSWKRSRTGGTEVPISSGGRSCDDQQAWSAPDGRGRPPGDAGAHPPGGVPSDTEPARSGALTGRMWTVLPE